MASMGASGDTSQPGNADPEDNSRREPLQGGPNAGRSDPPPAETKRKYRKRKLTPYEKAVERVKEKEQERGPRGNDYTVLSEKLAVWERYLKGEGCVAIAKELRLEPSWVSVLCKQAIAELRELGESKIEERRDRSVAVLRKLQLEAWQLYAWKQDVACLSEIRQAEMNIAKLYGLLVDKIAGPDGGAIALKITELEIKPAITNGTGVVTPFLEVISGDRSQNKG